MAIVARSFRLVTARLIPRPCRCKQALLLATVILAGCGGSGKDKAQQQTVAGAGYRFAAPSGWTIERKRRRTTASEDGELVQVATFPLLKAYTPALFEPVARELSARMAQVAKQSGGTVSGERTVTAGGIKSHAYEVKVGDHVDEYTFVLRGMREYLLLCRRKASSSDDFCSSLVTSFVPA